MTASWKRPFSLRTPAKDKLLLSTAGGEIWVEIYTYPIVNSEGRVSHVIEYTRDITDRWKAEEERTKLIERLEYLSNTDVLTGLLNRRALIERLNYEVARAVRYNVNLSLILCDIDYFKEINDSYGHTCGDNALKVIAGILKNSLRSTDLLGRYGGDEFMLILPETSMQGAAEFAERIRASLEDARVRVKGRKSAGMSLSLGVTCLQHCKAGDDVDSLIRQADNALYSAKRTGRNRVCVSGS
jgi:diguanylate cyclase (GGDEF)-like protein